jgi:large subunit ribosomal protein L24
MSIKFKLKKGDKVIVLAGKSKGTVGEILKVFPSNKRVLVRGVNMVKRHTKPTQNAAGGIIEKENTIDISNISFYDDTKKRASRLGYKVLEDGRKVRFSKISGEVIDK